MVAFYNKGDQEIYKDYQFVPQEKYRTGFTAPTTEEEVTESFGIPATDAFTNSDGGYNPYMPNTSLNTTYRPNYDYRKSVDYNPELSDLQNQKIMQGMSNFKGYDYYNKPDPTGVEKLLGQAINYVPYINTIKRGAEFLGNALQGVMPINRRAIMENELRGAGIYTDDIGRIAIGQGGTYNTPEGIMAGYNAYHMNDKTFDKRTANIGKSLQDRTSLTEQQINDIVNEISETGKYSGDLTDEDLGVKNLFSNLINVNKAKFNFRNKKIESDKIYEFEKKRKEDEKLAKQGKIRLGDNLVQDTTYKSDPALSREGRENYTGKGMAFEKQSGGVTGKGTANERNYGGRKDGGRVGLAPGGPAGGASAGGNYGGNVNPEQEYAGRTFEETYGGDNTNNTTVVPKTNYVDVKPELLRGNPYVNFSLMSPLEIAKIQANIGYKDIFDNDDLYAEGDFTTNIGPVTTNTEFTDDGIGNTDINYGNFSTTIDPSKNIKNIGYNNSYNGVNYGVNYADGNTMFNVGATFKNGGLASIL